MMETSLRMPPPTELDQLDYDLGGPAHLNIGMDKMALSLCCRCYPLSCLEPLLSEHCWDHNRVRRHWPLAAFALDQYVFERSRLNAPRINSCASDLERVLIELYRGAAALNRKYARLNFSNVRIFDRLFASPVQPRSGSDAVGGKGLSADDPGRGDRVRLQTASDLRMVLMRVTALKAAAAEAIQMVDASLLERQRGQVANPPLSKLVGRTAKIWRSLTGSQPTTMSGSGTIATQPFVRFVQALAALGDGSSPSHQQITAALRSRRHRTQCQMAPQRKRPH